MNFMKRAYLYLLRKKGKTIILLAFLLAMATMMLTCISIYSATGTSTANIKKSLMAYFTINAKHLDYGMDQEVIDQILAIDGLSGNYNLRSYTEATYYGNDGEKLEIETESAYLVPEGYENAGKMIGTDDSESSTYFTEGTFELIEGTAITDGQENTALVHKDFADRNNLFIGDCIQLEDVETGNTVTLKIIGIFRNIAQQDSGMNYSYALYENMVFVTMDTCSTLLFGETELYQYGDFYVDDPEQLDVIIDAVKGIPGVEWDRCIITKYDKDYQNAKTVLESLQNIVFVAMIVIVAVCFAVLALLLTFRLRNRVHEMGVLLSMGISKKAILMQQLAEVLIVAVFALLLSFASSSLISQQVGNSLLTQAAADEYQIVDLTGSDTQNDTEADNVNTQQEVNLTEIDVSISALDYLMVCCVGILLCAASTALAIIPILRMKPKNILSQMN